MEQVQSAFRSLYKLDPPGVVSHRYWIQEGNERNAPLFVSAAFIYLIVTWTLVKIMKNRPAFTLRPILVVWNISLSLLSLIGAIVMVPYTINEIQELGFHAFVCSEKWFRVESVTITLSLFTYSKIPELMDTLWLALRKRKIMLLHWYHHFTVLLYVWWAGYHNIGSAGVVFGTMNLVVHALMYGYYAIGAMGYRPPFPMAITVLQIAQMIVGTYTVVISAPCANHLSTYYAALLMYSSYAVLFILFFLQRYVFAGQARKNEMDMRISKDKVY